MDAVRRQSPSRRDHHMKTLRAKVLPQDLDTGSTGKSEIRNLEECVNIHARRYNELKSKCGKKQKEVDRLMDTLAALDKEIDSLRRMEKNDTPETVRIEDLRQRIQNVEKEIEDKMFRRKQLEHMDRRLHEEEITLDTQVKSMEDALEASKKEFDEVKLLLRQLEAKKQECVVELQNVQIEVEVAHKLRQRQLEERRQRASNARRMEEWRKKREQQRRASGSEKQDLGTEEEEALVAAVKLKEDKAKQLKLRSKMEYDKAMTLEEAFTQIRQATGVNTLEEMVEKFMGQKANKEALLEEKKEAESQLKSLRQQQQQVEEKFAAMKASGIGGSELNREIYDRLDDEITEAKRELRSSMDANKRLEEVLVNVRLGAFGLLKRLEPFNHIVDSQEESDLPKTANEALDALLKAELRLNRMIELAVVADKQSLEEKSKIERDFNAVPKVTVKWDPSQENGIHANNIRVDSHTICNKREVAMVEVAAEYDSDEDLDMFELRGSVKSKSEHRIYRHHHPGGSGVKAAHNKEAKETEHYSPVRKEAKAPVKKVTKKSKGRSSGKTRRRRGNTRRPDQM